MSSPDVRLEELVPWGGTGLLIMKDQKKGWLRWEKRYPLNLYSSVHQLYHSKAGREEKMEKEKLRELHYLTALTYFSQQIRSQGVLPGVKEKVIGYGV